jgi:SH3-like domain-containing protein
MPRLPRFVSLRSLNDRGLGVPRFVSLRSLNDRGNGGYQAVHASALTA